MDLHEIEELLVDNGINTNGFLEQDFLVIKPQQLQDDHFIWENTLPVIINGDLSLRGTFFCKNELSNTYIQQPEEEKEQSKTKYDTCLNLKGIIEKHRKIKKPVKGKAIFVVLGDLLCENAIFACHPDLLFVSGKIAVRNIALYTNQANHTIASQEGNSTKYLIHGTENNLDLNTIFSYEKEISHKSQNITDQSILIPEIDTFTKYVLQKYFYDRVFDRLSKNHSIINENISVINVKGYNADRLVYQLTMHDTHIQVSGLEHAFIDVKYESDKAVFDKRHGSRFWGIQHETQYFYPVKIDKKKPAIEEFSPSSGNTVLSTEALYARYAWICTDLFDNCSESYIDIEKYYFNSKEAIDALWEKEKTVIHSDVFLALYWLLHFGFLFDQRFTEVKDIIDKMAEQEKEKLSLVGNALDLFESDHFANPVKIECRYKEKRKDDDKAQEFETIFLRRRSHLTSWYYREVDSFNEWTIPFLIYPDPDEKYTEKVYFLKKNIEKHNTWMQWQAFFEKHPQFPLANYINAFMPNTEDKANCIQQAIKETHRIEKQFPQPSYRKSYTQNILNELESLMETHQT